MAGFLSPGLGFSSTIGAAITGAARQANTMLDEQRKQERQDDILNDAWAINFDNNSKKYDDLKRQQKQLSDVRNTFKSLAGGSEMAADMALNAYQANPKDYAKIVNSLQETASKGMKDPDGYKSPFEENQNSQLQDQRSRLESNYNRLNPRNKGLVTMPDASGGGNSQGGDYGGGAPTQPQGSTMPPGNTGMVGQSPTQGNVGIGQPQMGTPSMAMPTKSPGGNMMPSNNGAMVGQPQRDIPGSGGQSATPGAQSFNPSTPMGAGSNVPADPNRPIPAYGKPDVPAPSPDQGGDNSVPPVPQGQFPNTQYQAPQQVAQNSGPNVMFPSFARNSNNTMTPYQQQHIDLMTKEFDLKRSQKLATPREQKDLEIQTDDAKKYLHDTKTGLQARYADLGSLQSQNYNLSEISDVLTRGFSSNAVQPMFNDLNRFTTATLGLDLRSAGIDANAISDVNTLRKAVSNAVIERLKTLHFGRITNYESQLVQSGFMNEKNDPNTNMKISLTLQASVKYAMAKVQAEHDAAYAPGNPTLDSVATGRQAGRQLDAQYLSQDRPWQQFQVNEKSLPQIGKLPVGSWFEDAGKGADGRMLQVADTSNGMMTLRGADGRVFKVPMGR